MTGKDWNDESLRCLALQMSGVVDSRAGSHADPRQIVIFCAVPQP